MTERNLLSRLRIDLQKVPIVYRLFIGNTVLAAAIVAAALLAHEYYPENETLLVLVSAGAGFLLLFFFNYLTIRISLAALKDLQQTIDEVSLEHPVLPEEIVLETDPDLQPLAQSINDMLTRLERSRRELRALSERATHAQEEERRRIARNLHDETSQALSSLIISLEQMENSLPAESAHLRPRLRKAHELADRTLEDLRNIIYDLRPTMLDDLGLVSAIRWYARSTLEESGILVEFDLPDQPVGLPEHLETELFRIAQEGINNILRHSQASQVLVRLQREERYVCLELEDNGRGFDVADTADTALLNKRLGLLGIQERAALLGGEIQVQSTPGAGTRLQVLAPLVSRRP